MKKRDGFTLIEIMVVIALVGFLAAISILNLLASRRTAEYSVCLENRRVIENAETTYLANIKTHSASLQQLLDSGYLNKIPNCPSSGIFAWEPYEITSPYYQTSLGCSFHALEAEEAVVAEVVVEVKETKKSKNKK
ncbi:MAG: type II secretion system protein [Candidatus Omnitrophota bacterium]